MHLINLKIGLILACFLACGSFALAQKVKVRKSVEKQIEQGEDFFTENTSVGQTTFKNKKKRKPDEKLKEGDESLGEVYLKLYVDHTRAVIFRNPCITEYTHLRGFEYAPLYDFRNSAEFTTREIWWANTKTEWKLFWRLGPFWKKRVLNKIRECLKVSGDFLGKAPTNTPLDNCEELVLEVSPLGPVEYQGFEQNLESPLR